MNVSFPSKYKVGRIRFWTLLRLLPLAGAYGGVRNLAFCSYYCVRNLIFCSLSLINVFASQFDMQLFRIAIFLLVYMNMLTEIKGSVIIFTDLY